MENQFLLWLFFNLGVGILLFLDLFLIHRKASVIPIKEALWNTGFWIVLALFVNWIVYLYFGPQEAINYLTGYIIEKALSVDNLFVFLLIFSYFQVPSHLLHKVLFWGILGAIVMRAIFIFIGISLISMFHWILYVFGFFLVYAGIKMSLKKGVTVDPKSNTLISLLCYWIPVTSQYHGDHFFVKKDFVLMATPLFLALVSIELADLVFALDSIPAILGITTNPFVVYSSNILAILGLRSLFFVISPMLELFQYLHYGLSAILIFIGLKMLLSGYFTIPIFVSLGIVLSCLILSILVSLLFPKAFSKKS